MTEEQKKAAFEAGEEIRAMPGGKHYRIFASNMIIRIQDEKDNTNYRLYSPPDSVSPGLVRAKILDIFAVMKKAERRKKKGE